MLEFFIFFSQIVHSYPIFINMEFFFQKKKEIPNPRIFPNICRRYVDVSFFNYFQVSVGFVVNWRRFLITLYLRDCHWRRFRSCSFPSPVFPSQLQNLRWNISCVRFVLEPSLSFSFKKTAIKLFLFQRITMLLSSPTRLRTIENKVKVFLFLRDESRENNWLKIIRYV